MCVNTCNTVYETCQSYTNTDLTHNVCGPQIKVNSMHRVLQDTGMNDFKRVDNYMPRDMQCKVTKSLVKYYIYILNSIH